MINVNRHLTKEMLEQNGIYDVYWDEESNDWYIDRYWYKNSSKEKTHRRIKTTISVRKHKYTQDKCYPVVTFSNKNKITCLPLSRFLYAWFKGEVKEGQVIDHIDNDPFNNKLENLQALTPEENLAKRFIDNPNANRNQWDVINKEKYKKELIDKYYTAQSELVNVINKLSDVEIEHEDDALQVIDNITNYIMKTIH